MSLESEAVDVPVEIAVEAGGSSTAMAAGEPDEMVQPAAGDDDYSFVDLPDPDRHSSESLPRGSNSASRHGSQSGSLDGHEDNRQINSSGASQNERQSASAPASNQRSIPLVRKVQVNPKPKQPPLPRSGEDPPGAADEEKQPARQRWLPGTRERVYHVSGHSASTAPQLHSGIVLSTSLRTHPKGFRLLKQTSPLERRMNTYFRLPPQPPRRVGEEQSRVLRQIQRDILAPPSGAASSSKPQQDVMLDGFMLLERAGVQDPMDAKEVVINDARIRGVVTEDLGYFTNLTFIDLGENDAIHLGDIIGLEALTEVHMHCCNVDTFRLPKEEELQMMRQQGLYSSASVFPSLVTLNVSFNRIRSSELLQLNQLRALERLDLSSNNLKSLPSDMSFLPNVTMLALENNNFASPDVILSLATMPSLVEVNLNRNRLSSIPRLSVEDGTGVCFPSIEVIGLGSNNLTYFEDVYSLTQLSSLRRVVLWGNPIEHRVKDTEILRFEFGSLDIEALFELPIPPKRKIADFYAANAANFVAVSMKDLKPLPVVKLNRHFATGAPAPSAPQTAAHTGPDGPSFFVTQPGEIPGMGSEQQGTSEHVRHDAGPSQAEDPSDPSWFSGEQHDAVERTESRPRQQRAPVGSTGLGADLAAGSTTPQSEDLPPLDDDGGLDFNRSYASMKGGGNDFSPPGHGRKKDKAGGGGGSPQRFRGAASGGVDLCRPNQTMRAAMTELRRMLRQPLPPLHVTQYEQTTQSLSQRIVKQR